VTMSRVLIQMSMSLDGYVAGLNDSDANPLGDHGLRLHEWMFAGPGRPPGEELPKPDQQMFDELRSMTGAMICGRRLYDITHGWNGSHPFGAIPTFVVTRSVPDTVPTGTTSFTFVTEGIVSAVVQAQDVAGGKDVYVIGGASIDQQLLDADLADELRIDVVPVLLGSGIRLFDQLRRSPVDLEQVNVTPSQRVTHLRYRVLR
jgi:dihydrofolate reductase